MKVCQACGDTYRDHVDFCFNDGEILAMADAETVSGHTPESELDAPLPRMVQGAQAASAATGTPQPPPRTGAPAGGTVPAPNAPTDPVPDSGEGEGHDLEISPAGVDEDEPAEVGTAEEPDPIEATSPRTPAVAGPQKLSARDGIPARPPSTIETLPPSSAETVPPAPDEPREPMRVAPLSEAETTPFVRPKKPRPSDTDTPISSPRAAARSTGAPPLHVPPPPKRRVGGPIPEAQQDRSGLLWFGAILMGIAVAVPFLAGVALIWFLVVGISGGQSDDVVAIAPRSAEVGALPRGPDPVVDGVMPPIDPPEPEVADAELDPLGETPKPNPPSPAPSDFGSPSRQVTIEFRLTPRDARVYERGSKTPISMGSNYTITRPEGRYEFTVSHDDFCPQQVSWPGMSRDGVLTAVLDRDCFQQGPSPAPAPAPVSEARVNVLFLGQGGELWVNGQLLHHVNNQSVPVPPGTHQCKFVADVGATYEWRCVFRDKARLVVNLDEGGNLVVRSSE